MSKTFLYTLFLICIQYSVWAQDITIPIKKIKELKEDEDCYTLHYNDSLTVTFCKGDDASQLNAYGGNGIWLGKNHPYSRYSELVITFSHPVKSVQLALNHFNNDVDSGRERVDDFHTYAKDGKEIPHPSIQWAPLEIPESEFTTFYNPFRQEISATDGGWGDESGGTLTISNPIPFTRVTFRQVALTGQPNGVIISKAIKVSLATPQDSVLTLEPSIDSLMMSMNDHRDIDLELHDTLSIKQQQEVYTVLKPIKDSSTSAQLTIPPKTKTPPAPVRKKQTTVNKKTTTVGIKPQIKPVKTSSSPAKTLTKKTPVKKKPYTSRKKKTPPPEIKGLAEVRTLQPGDRINLNRVYFKQSLPELLPHSYGILDTLAMILQALPSITLEIQGHTDNQGNPQLNLELSEKRAQAVRAYLLSKGIAPERLTAKGYGSTRPLTDNSTEENRKQNRRVEFIILSK